MVLNRAVHQQNIGLLINILKRKKKEERGSRRKEGRGRKGKGEEEGNERRNEKGREEARTQ